MVAGKGRPRGRDGVASRGGRRDTLSRNERIKWQRGRISEKFSTKDLRETAVRNVS